MKLDLNNITFIIVCFKSENVIHSCLNSLPKISKKIVIENSRNTKLKEELESKYDNIEVLINHNLGMGASNNIGILRSKTQFVYILNPDTKLNVSTMDKLIDATDKIVDFAILSPLCSDSRFPNYKIYEKKSSLNQCESLIENLTKYFKIKVTKKVVKRIGINKFPNTVIYFYFLLRFLIFILVLGPMQLVYLQHLLVLGLVFL